MHLLSKWHRPDMKRSVSHQPTVDSHGAAWHSAAMAPRTIAFGLVLLAAIALSARAADPATDSASVQQIKDLEQRWLDGLKKPDSGALETILADDFTLTGPDGKVVGKDQFIQGLKDGGLKIDSIDNSDIKIRVYGEAAVAVGKTSIKGNIGGNDITGDYAFTDTFIHKDGKWQEVAGQVNRLGQ
jgi:ketosteroid isomerase-like protein